MFICATGVKLIEYRLDRLPIRHIFVILFLLCSLMATFLILLSPSRMEFSFIGPDLRFWLPFFALMVYLAYNSKTNQNALLFLACAALIAAMGDLIFFFLAEINFWRIMVLFEYSLIPILAQDKWGQRFLGVYAWVGFLHFFI